MGVAGPSEALTVSSMKKSAVLEPVLALTSQRTPLATGPRRPATSDVSRTSPPNCGVKPPGKRSWKEEAVRIGEDLREGGRRGSSVDDRHGGAVGGSVGRTVPRVAHVADEQALSAVGAEDRGPGVRVPEEEAAGYPPAGVIGVAVRLHTAGEQVADIGPELDVVVNPWGSPDLRRIGDRLVPGRDQACGVGPLHAAAGSGRCCRIRG